MTSNFLCHTTVVKLVKRSCFELPLKGVTWLKSLGRQKQSEGILCSTRKRKPTYPYADECDTNVTPIYTRLYIPEV